MGHNPTRGYYVLPCTFFLARGSHRNCRQTCSKHTKQTCLEHAREHRVYFVRCTEGSVVQLFKCKETPMSCSCANHVGQSIRVYGGRTSSLLAEVSPVRERMAAWGCSVTLFHLGMHRSGRHASRPSQATRMSRDPEERVRATVVRVQRSAAVTEARSHVIRLKAWDWPGWLV